VLAPFHYKVDGGVSCRLNFLMEFRFSSPHVGPVMDFTVMAATENIAL
jgi:ribosome-associated toxin RatA of RatAB toxin-antitoxin module